MSGAGEGPTRWRDALRAANREPGEDWRERFVHHGVRVVVVGLAALAVFFLFPRSPLPNFALLEEGMVAPRDVIAEIPFSVRKPPEELEEQRSEAADSVAPVFSVDSAAVDSTLARLDAFFAGLDSAVAAPSADGEAVRQWLESHGLSPSAGQTTYLTRAEGRAFLLEQVGRAFRELLPRGVAQASEVRSLEDDRVMVRRGGSARVVPRDSLQTLGEFYRTASDRALPDSTPTAVQLYQTLLVRFVEPTLRFDRAETERARDRARQAVEETESFVLEGERIVAAHERVGAPEMAKLRAYRDALMDRSGTGEERLLERAGSFLYALVLLGLLALLLRFHRESVYRDAPRFLIVVLSLLVSVAVASWIGRADAPMMLIPAAFPALVVAALFDGFLGVATAFILAALLAGQPDFAGVTVPFTVVVGGASGALAVPWIRRRSESWVLITAITGGYVLAGGALALLRYFSVMDWVTGVGWGAVNATTCTVFAMGAVVPVLEKLTGITTDQTLLEYSDLNRPLLQRLSREAPGTYAHSVNVANLAEAACSAIGANALLARVGSYYHDVGKMTRPQYFIENQPRGRNPHDRLQPSRSAAVIREHVREGLRLAEEEGIPDVIRDFIAEHHGTQQIVYFLRKARAGVPDLELDPADFAYPGPKPRSKETAVLMLADGVESATRTLQEPSSERIRELIESIVDARMEEGQLDRCPLTLQDIDRVKSEFARILTGMYHHRIDYPGPTPDAGDGGLPEGEAAERPEGRPEREPASAGGSGDASGSGGEGPA